jgi:hypothetical protein
MLQTSRRSSDVNRTTPNPTCVPCHVFTPSRSAPPAGLPAASCLRIGQPLTPAPMPLRSLRSLFRAAQGKSSHTPRPTDGLGARKGSFRQTDLGRTQGSLEVWCRGGSQGVWIPLEQSFAIKSRRSSLRHLAVQIRRTRPFPSGLPIVGVTRHRNRITGVLTSLMRTSGAGGVALARHSTCGQRNRLVKGFSSVGQTEVRHRGTHLTTAQA